jgi:hypothetical protein
VGAVGAFLCDDAFEGVQPFLGFLGVDVSPDSCVFAAMVLSPHDLRVVGCCGYGNVLSLQTGAGPDHGPIFRNIKPNRDVQ